MSGIGINYLTNNNYISSSFKETQPKLCLKTDNISINRTTEKDSFKSELFSEKPLNGIKAKTELGFVDIDMNNSEPPTSSAKANITYFNKYKHVSSENADFFYVNGIMTEYDDAKKTASLLSEIMGKKVDSLWSKKEGFLGDLIKTVKIDQENSIGNTSSETSQEITASVIHSLRNGKNVKLIAHSRGATETANSLWDVRSRLAISGRTEEDINKLMSHIEVVTIGGVATPSDFPSDIKLTQIKNPDDPVPKLNSSKLSVYRNNERSHRYSRTEMLITQKTIENNVNHLNQSERHALYDKHIDDGKANYSIATNMSEKTKVALSIFNSNVEAEYKKSNSFGFSTFPISPNNTFTYLKAVVDSIETLVSSHLINAGDNNYLGEENVQNILNKVAND